MQRLPLIVPRTLQPCLAGLLALIAFSGCSSKEISTETEVPPPDSSQPAVPSQAAEATSSAISAARDALNAGNVDEAAAKLAQLQMQQAAFNTQQAKDYREAMSEAYDRAIEAAQRGDPRAQAALQLLRGAGPR